MSTPDHSISVFDRFYFPLAILLDIDRLRQEVEELIKRVPLAFRGTRQIGLHSYRGSTDPWYDGCRKQSEIGTDSEYTVLHPDLHGSYIEEVFHQMPFQPFRARLMALDPLACYSVHNDSTPRYHLAIKTSIQARFVFVEHQRILHIHADGRVYFLDTRETHTAFNGGKEMRIHLVFGGPVISGYSAQNPLRSGFNS